MFNSGAMSKDKALLQNSRIKDAIGLVDAWINSLLDYGQIPIPVGFVVDQELIFMKGYGYSNLEVKSEPRRILFIVFVVSLSCSRRLELCSFAIQGC